jgi:hypothetical protein
MIANGSCKEESACCRDLMCLLGLKVALFCQMMQFTEALKLDQTKSSIMMWNPLAYLHNTGLVPSLSEITIELMSWLDGTSSGISIFSQCICGYLAMEMLCAILYYGPKMLARTLGNSIYILEFIFLVAILFYCLCTSDQYVNKLTPQAADIVKSLWKVSGTQLTQILNISRDIFLKSCDGLFSFAHFIMKNPYIAQAETFLSSALGGSSSTILL